MSLGNKDCSRKEVLGVVHSCLFGEFRSYNLGLMVLGRSLGSRMQAKIPHTRREFQHEPVEQFDLENLSQSVEFQFPIPFFIKIIIKKIAAKQKR